MQSGKLRHRVSIERPTTGDEDEDDAIGEASLTWAPLTSCWADIRPLSGRELLAAKQVQSEVSHAIRIRANAQTKTITSRDRVKFGARVFEITSAINLDERAKEIVLSAVERVKPAEP